MKIIIIGGDAAGMSAASQIRRIHPDWEMIVFEKGQDTSYGACGIPYVLAGEIASLDDLVVVSPDEFRNQRGIDVRTGYEVTVIGRNTKTVDVRDVSGKIESHSYDRLLIATGASAIVPAWPGIDLPGVKSLRTLEDARQLQQWKLNAGSNVVIVGAGYIGLELTEAYTMQGHAVTVLEKQAGVLAAADPALGEQIAKELAAHNVELRTGITVTGFSGNTKVGSVSTHAGEIPADLVIVALGVTPNSQLAVAAGLQIGPRGAIMTDAQMRTSDPDIFAAGDCTASLHRITGEPTWIPLALTANRMGRVAGTAMANGEAAFPGVLGTAVVKVFDLYAGFTGLTEAAAGEAGFDVQTVEVTAGSNAHYYPGGSPVWLRLVFAEADGKLLGATIRGADAGVTGRLDTLATAISAGLTVQQVSNLDLAYAPPFSPVWDPVLQAANRALFARKKAP